KVLTREIAGGCKMLRGKDVADGDFYHPFFIPDGFLDTCVQVPKCMRAEGSLKNSWRGIKTRDIGGPIFTQAETLLGEKVGGDDMEVDDPACAEIGVINRVIGIQVGEKAIAPDRQRIAKVEAGDVLGGQIDFFEKGLGSVCRVYQLRKDVADVTVVESGDQF